MMLTEVTAVPDSALPVAPFKDHLRLGSGFADDGLQDGLLATYLRAAMAAIEARTGKILIEREFRLILARWRGEQGHALPVAPVSAMTEVALIDADGADHLLEAGQWRLDPDTQRPMLMPRGYSLPPVPTGGFLRLGFLAGFGPDWSDLPADLAQAVLMLAAQFYDNRTATGGGGTDFPPAVAALVERYRTVRLFLGAGRG